MEFATLPHWPETGLSRKWVSVRTQQFLIGFHHLPANGRFEAVYGDLFWLDPTLHDKDKNGHIQFLDGAVISLSKKVTEFEPDGENKWDSTNSYEVVGPGQIISTSFYPGFSMSQWKTTITCLEPVDWPEVWQPLQIRGD